MSVIILINLSSNQPVVRCACIPLSKKMSKLFKVCLKLKTAAGLLIQQAKVRRNSFITIQGHLYNKTQLCSLYNVNNGISTYRVHVLYYLTETFVYFRG